MFLQKTFFQRGKIEIKITFGHVGFTSVKSFQRKIFVSIEISELNVLVAFLLQNCDCYQQFLDGSELVEILTPDKFYRNRAWQQLAHVSLSSYFYNEDKLLLLKPAYIIFQPESLDIFPLAFQLNRVWCLGRVREKQTPSHLRIILMAYCIAF